uniref:ATP synthase F0 subunit 6 n=1 Tax=Cobbenicoris guangxiensis TaxID=3020184 RepID=UPI0024112B3B|nr:ATP synthase F0 subunit 6 [Cobbenicoris guangxiensis]WEM32404.1 ATP synthase F0 subunit 6 [Cobbenicoris guangxiensis]
MMNNLFSAFDPSTNMKMSLNWISTCFVLFILPMSFWTMPNRSVSLFYKLLMILFSEFKMILGEKSKGTSMMMISLFMFIMANNMMGLMPYIFTSSSHLTFTLSMALPLWMSFMMFGWINNTNHMLAHLVPLGTPNILMPFMIIIETISNIIRPGSLAVRLTANMIAGHLLMSLLGNNSLIVTNFMLWFIISVQVMLMIFEVAVSFIQAYVFSILSTLYSSEI